MSAVSPPSSAQRAMHVLAAARSLPFHGIGGMQAIAWDVLRGLARRGHRITVLTTAIPGRRGEAFAADGVTVVPLAGTVPGRYSGGWWRASRRYAERHLSEPADAVLSVSSAAAGLLPLKRSKLAVPFVFQAHGSSWAEARSKWQSPRPLDWVKAARNVYWLAKDARIYRGFDRLVFVGDSLAAQFAAPPLVWMTRGIPRATIVNGVDTTLFRYDAGSRAAARARYGFVQSDRVLVFAARLHAHKGAAEALRALAALRARDRAYRLLIVGRRRRGAVSAPARRRARLRGRREVRRRRATRGNAGAALCGRRVRIPRARPRRVAVERARSAQHRLAVRVRRQLAGHFRGARRHRLRAAARCWRVRGRDRRDCVAARRPLRRCCRRAIRSSAASAPTKRRSVAGRGAEPCSARPERCCSGASPARCSAWRASSSPRACSARAPSPSRIG